MEVKIGIQSVPRELVVETDTPAEEIERRLSSVLDSDDGSAVFVIEVSKGGKVLVPADKIAYVEFSGPESRRIGFGNIVLRSQLSRTGLGTVGSPPGTLGSGRARGEIARPKDRVVRTAVRRRARSLAIWEPKGQTRGERQCRLTAAALLAAGLPDRPRRTPQAPGQRQKPEQRASATRFDPDRTGEDHDEGRNP